MLLSEIFKKTEYKIPPQECEISKITCDSREADASALFVCIKGYMRDGHSYIADAASRGCRAFLVERESADIPEGSATVVVPDTKKALAEASCELFGNPSHSLTVIGVTGTKGKTTTALMLRGILERSGIKTGYIGSNGIIWRDEHEATENTTPQSSVLQKYLRKMLDDGIGAVVLEVSSQALALGRVYGTKFDVAIFTNFSPDHVGPGEHASTEEYFLAKKRLFDDYSPKIAIANADDASTEKILADFSGEKIFYSVSSPADLRAQSIIPLRTDETLGSAFLCRAEDESIECKINMPGEFNVSNALAAIAAARALGISAENISAAAPHLSAEGRFEVLHSPSGASFVIDYAHNGVSLEAILKTLRAYNPRRLVCLYGSVGGRTELRRAQMGDVASRYADFSILTSDNPDRESPEKIIDDIAARYADASSFVAIPDRRAAIEYAVAIARRGDIVLLAGKGHEKYQLINGKKEYFNEREILSEAISAQRAEIPMPN